MPKLIKKTLTAHVTVKAMPPSTELIHRFFIRHWWLIALSIFVSIIPNLVNFFYQIISPWISLIIGSIFSAGSFIVGSNAILQKELRIRKP